MINFILFFHISQMIYDKYNQVGKKIKLFWKKMCQAPFT